MIDHLRRVADLIRAAEKIAGDHFKVAGFGNADTTTYCIVVTPVDHPDVMSLLEAIEMINRGILEQLRAVKAMEDSIDDEEVIKH